MLLGRAKADTSVAFSRVGALTSTGEWHPSQMAPNVGLPACVVEYLLSPWSTALRSQLLSNKMLVVVICSWLKICAAYNVYR